MMRSYLAHFRTELGRATKLYFGTAVVILAMIALLQAGARAPVPTAIFAVAIFILYLFRRSDGSLLYTWFDFYHRMFNLYRPIERILWAMPVSSNLLYRYFSGFKTRSVPDLRTLRRFSTALQSIMRWLSGSRGVPIEGNIVAFGFPRAERRMLGAFFGAFGCFVHDLSPFVLTHSSALAEHRTLLIYGGGAEIFGTYTSSLRPYLITRDSTPDEIFAAIRAIASNNTASLTLREVEPKIVDAIQAVIFLTQSSLYDHALNFRLDQETDTAVTELIAKLRERHS